MILLRILFFPVRLILGVLGFSLKLGYKAGSLPFKATAGTARLVKFRGFVFFGLGLGVGLLLAPVAGHELRARLRKMIEGTQPPTDAELADKVGFELSHAPRTWHLPQPDVAVVAGRVELTGTVPHETGREELERVASAVPGVVGVENRLDVVAGSGEGGNGAGNGSGAGDDA